MPAILPFIPLIASGMGLLGGVLSGNQAQDNNNQTRADQKAINAQQQGNFDTANSYNAPMQGLIGQYGQVGKDYNGGMGQQMGYLEGLKGQYGALDQGYQGLSDKLGGLDSQYGKQGDQLGQLLASLEQKGYQSADTSGMQNALMGAGNSLLGTVTRDAYQNQAQLAGQDALGQISSDMAARGIGTSGVTERTGSSTLARLYANANTQYNQDRMQATGIANNAFGQAGQLNISTAGTNNAAQQNFGQLMASLLGQQGNLTGARAGLLGQQGNFLGARAGLVGQQQGLGQLLASLLGQSAGVNQGLIGAQLQGYQGLQNGQLNMAQILGGKEASLNQNINPNPYGGVGTTLGAIGTAAGAYVNNQQQQPLINAETAYYNRLNQPPATTQPYYPPGNTAGPYGPSR